MINRKSYLNRFPDVKLQKKLDILKFHTYSKLCMEYQALPVTAACMAEIFGRV
jgi:hypothetical protein